MDRIVEQFAGGAGGAGGLFGGIFGEAREAVLGGCWGILMSAGFFFFFFATGIALFTEVRGLPIQITWSASPIIVGLCVSGLMSPVMGILFGLQTGFYKVGRHIGCFVIYLVAFIAGIFLASAYL